MFDDLTEDNYILYAVKNYENHQCTGLKEFYEDLNYIKYIKRLFNRYLVNGELKDRLICNHIIFLYNNFKPEAITRILFLKLEEKYWLLLKPILLQMEFLPDVIRGVNGKDINTVDIKLDKELVERMREI